MGGHTPGSWSVYEDVCKVAAHGAKNLVSSSAYGDYYTESLTDDRGEFFNPADARLFAAAPEMLEALRLVRADLRAMVKVFGHGEQVDESLKAADAAIAKATGEQP